MTATRGAIYARISDDSEGRAAGVTRQVEDATALAQRQGWRLADLPPFIDNDISASTRSKARRPAFEDLVRRVDAGEIDGIAYYSSSRLTRRPAEFETIIALVERTGVQLASVASGIADLTTADGRMIARILAAQDAAEAERIGERVKRALQQRMSQGIPHPVPVAFGFRPGGMDIDPVQAELIVEAADRVADEGWSLGMVAIDWTNRGIPRPKGDLEPWTATQVHRALLSPRTAGIVDYKGQAVSSFPSILTPKRQREVGTVLKGRRLGQMPSFKERKNLLAGFLVCGKCGSLLRVNALYEKDGSLRRDAYVSCTKVRRGCGSLKRNLPMLMEYVDGLIRLRLEAWEPVGVEDAVDTEDERQRLAEIEEDIEEARLAFEGGAMRFKDYNAALGALRTQQEATQRALDAKLASSYTPDGLDVLEAWEHGTLLERREVLAVLVDHIRLHPIGWVGAVRARQMVPETTEVVWK